MLKILEKIFSTKKKIRLLKTDDTIIQKINILQQTEKEIRSITSKINSSSATTRFWLESQNQIRQQIKILNLISDTMEFQILQDSVYCLCEKTANQKQITESTYREMQKTLKKISKFQSEYQKNYKLVEPQQAGISLKISRLKLNLQSLTNHFHPEGEAEYIPEEFILNFLKYKNVDKTKIDFEKLFKIDEMNLIIGEIKKIQSKRSYLNRFFEK